MLIWIIVYIFAAAASIAGVLPIMDPYAYVVGGICVGYVAVAAIGVWGYNGGGLRPHIIVVMGALAGGVAAGLFWPASLAMGAAWLIYRYRRFRRAVAELPLVVEADGEDPLSQSPERRRS